MLIESNISEILLNVSPVYSIAPDKRIFPAYFQEYFIVTTIRVPRVLTDVIFVFSLQVIL